MPESRKPLKNLWRSKVLPKETSLYLWRSKVPLPKSLKNFWTSKVKEQKPLKCLWPTRNELRLGLLMIMEDNLLLISKFLYLNLKSQATTVWPWGTICLGFRSWEMVKDFQNCQKKISPEVSLNWPDWNSLVPKYFLITKFHMKWFYNKKYQILFLIVLHNIFRIYLVSRNRGNVGSNLKIVVLRNKFELNYFFSVF